MRAKAIGDGGVAIRCGSVRGVLILEYRNRVSPGVKLRSQIPIAYIDQWVGELVRGLSDNKLCPRERSIESEVVLRDDRHVRENGEGGAVRSGRDLLRCERRGKLVDDEKDVVVDRKVAGAVARCDVDLALHTEITRCPVVYEPPDFVGSLHNYK